MRYAQVKPGQKLHMALEPGEQLPPGPMVPAGQLSKPLCNRPNVSGYRATFNVTFGELCKNCLRVYHSRMKS